MGVAMCRLLNAFVMTWIEPTPRFPSLGIISTFVAPVAGRLQITLIVIWTFSNQDTTSLALLFLSHIRLSLLVPVGVLQSSLLQGFLPQLMLPVLHVQIRHLSEDLACHPSQALPLKIVVVHASSNLPRHSRLPEERYRDRFATSADCSDSRRHRSRESPSPKRMGVTSRGSPSPMRMGFASRGSPSPKGMGFASRVSPSPQRMGFASRGSPSPKRMEFASRVSPSPQRMGFASRGSPSPKRMGFASGVSPSPQRMGFASRGSPSPKRKGFASRESPSPKRQRFASRDSASPRRQHSSRASSGDDSFERPPSRSSPTRPSSPSRDDKEADEASMPAPVKAMIEFILKSFPDAQASPSHPSSRSFDLSAYASVTDAAIPSGSLLAWCHAMSDAFSDTQQRFTHRIKDGKVCHPLLPTLNKFERVSNSPTQGKELKANPDVLDLLRNRVPDSRHVPMSLKEAVAVERSLRSGLESHNFLTWSVVALIRSLHEKKLLPMDDPVISQLQKSFSKACGNVASCLTSNAAFVTLKRRQLLLSHVVPSVSNAQKRNLLSDPFFQTSSLFSASSVEAARSAARDLSLFKPHLKASSPPVF